MHRIQIDKIEGVYGTKVGCQRFSYFTAEALLADLKAYLADPDGTAKKYYAHRDEMNRIEGKRLEDAPQPTGTSERAMNVAPGRIEPEDRAYSENAAITPGTPR
jgi:hypothetical protein